MKYELAVAVSGRDVQGREWVKLIDSSGEGVLYYKKAYERDGRSVELPVGVMETRAGTVRLGAILSDDAAFPELTRVLMLKGAEIILHPT